MKDSAFMKGRETRGDSQKRGWWSVAGELVTSAASQRVLNQERPGAPQGADASRRHLRVKRSIELLSNEMSLVLAGALPALLTFVPSVPLSYGCKASSPLLLSPHKQSIRPPSFGGRSGDVLLQGGGGGSGFGGGQ